MAMTIKCHDCGARMKDRMHPDFVGTHEFECRSCGAGAFVTDVNGWKAQEDLESIWGEMQKAAGAPGGSAGPAPDSAGPDTAPRSHDE